MTELFRSIGELDEIFDRHGAPERARKKIRKRTGGLGGLFPPKAVEIYIKTSTDEAGQTDWEKVEGRIGDTSKRLYQELKRPGARVNPPPITSQESRHFPSGPEYQGND